MKQFYRFYEADIGTDGGTPPAPEEPNESGKDKVVFTAEQQAKLDELIDKAFARGAAKAAKEAEEKAAREKQTDEERLAADRAALETEKARFKVQAALSKEGYTVDDDTDSALVGLFAAAPDVIEGNLTALKKLIDAKVNQEVDKRLQGAQQPTPKSGEKDCTVGDIINGTFRKAVAKN